MLSGGGPSPTAIGGFEYLCIHLRCFSRLDAQVRELTIKKEGKNQPVLLACEIIIYAKKDAEGMHQSYAACDWYCPTFPYYCIFHQKLPITIGVDAVVKDSLLLPSVSKVNAQCCWVREWNLRKVLTQAHKKYLVLNKPLFFLVQAVCFHKSSSRDKLFVVKGLRVGD